MPECRVPGKVAGKEVPRRCELVPDESEAEEPCPHGVLRILVLLRFRACRPHILCHLAECEAKLNVAFQLPCMDAAPALRCRLIELEKPELDGALREGRMVVEHMVSAVVVVLRPAVACSLRGVPDVRKLAHGLRLLAVDRLQEIRIHRAAVPVHAVAVELQSLCDQALVACHDVCEVAERLRRVAVRSDVDVDSAAPACIALCARVSQLSAKLLQGFDVAVGEDRRDHLAFLIIGSVYGNVPLEFPLPAVCVPCAPSHVSVSACRVLVSACSEEVGCNFRCLAPLDAVHLDLDPDGLFLHLGNLSLCLCVHGVCLLEILCFPRVSFPSVCLYITLKHTYIKLFLAIMYMNICP